MRLFVLLEGLLPTVTVLACNFSVQEIHSFDLTKLISSAPLVVRLHLCLDKMLCLLKVGSYLSNILLYIDLLILQVLDIFLDIFNANLQLVVL